MNADLLTFALFLLVVFVLLKATDRKRAVRRRSRPKRATESATHAKESAFCVRAIDGDTIVVVVDGQVERVRYIGMNAPEIGERGYEAAREANRRLVAGKMITMQRDRTDKDKHDRLLRYVWVGKTFVNAKLVRMGKAEVMVVAPNVSRIQEIAQ